MPLFSVEVVSDGEAGEKKEKNGDWYKNIPIKRIEPNRKPATNNFLDMQLLFIAI